MAHARGLTARGGLGKRRLFGGFCALHVFATGRHWQSQSDMKFSLDYTVSVDGRAIDSKALLADVHSLQNILVDGAALEGALLVHVEGKQLPAEYEEPLVRLVHLWVGKLPWVIGGDTETVALRNSAECFAFVPTGDGVEVSFYAGDDAAVEDYILEPTIVRLDMFVEESLRMAESLLQFLGRLSPAASVNEDVQDLKMSFDEAKKAWGENHPLVVYDQLTEKHTHTYI